ncbi:MAG TPA: transposase, partial [Cyanobacteria bacterium UBA11162]|nr:transposase [Cyanobacteria bacterium UBA11162]
GIEQGIERGAREAKLEIARQMLNLLDEETISQMTGLSLEEIQNLQRGEGE